jgi:FkbM family methyltransferase
MYQRSSPKYDRFLPHLVKFLKSGETVIDVGANVGDSLAAMAENNSAVNYICIEPDDTFFHFLTRNISRIKSAISDLKVYPVKSLVGKNVLNAVLEGKDGTKHAVINKNGTIQSRTLSEILVDLPSISNIRILKSDVDGFDYDVLDSSLDVMRDHRPMIFFECQYDCDYQKIGYEKMLSILEEEGYCDWIVFDNYGECVARTSDIKIVVQLIEYVWAQNIGNAYRTIYYYDILSVQNKDKGLIDRVLASYN